MTEVETTEVETTEVARTGTETATAPPDLDRPLRLHPLTYLEEGDEVTVGRADTDSYGLFPADGAALLRRLEAGSSPNEAGRWYTEQYGEQVDMAEFLEVLEEFDLVLKDGEQAAVARPVRWQRLGRALFSPVAWVCYAALFGAAVVACVRNPAIAPSYSHLFFTRSSLVALTLGIVLGQVPWILLHEAYHALAGRRLGLNSTLRIGRRFYYVVFVTSLDGLVAVPRRKRYLPMLAGMLFDVLIMSALTLLADALHSAGGAGALLDKLLLAMVFATVLRFAWQFYFFLRTDLYYLATTVMGCNDLQTVARQMLQNRYYRLTGRPERMVDEEGWHPRDRDVARWYQWLMVTGYGVLSVLLVTSVVPAAIRIMQMVVHKLGTSHSFPNILDVCVFLVLNFGELVLAGYLAVRGRRRRGRASTAATAAQN